METNEKAGIKVDFGYIWAKGVPFKDSHSVKMLVLSNKGGRNNATHFFLKTSIANSFGGNLLFLHI
ncbi:hypothetical protein H5410_045007 [Solanum commersonii]|uniref:Uncharacterized protein n=1 Tax=Solanum commersonii TaxID=4109 RepID=A0A9J5XAI3_SOLCO|nr:hypothetical protein H5410_045007 [Solanum commersonii]